MTRNWSIPEIQTLFDQSKTIVLTAANSGTGWIIPMAVTVFPESSRGQQKSAFFYNSRRSFWGFRFASKAYSVLTLLNMIRILRLQFLLFCISKYNQIHFGYISLFFS